MSDTQEKLSLQRISKLKIVFLLTSFYLAAEIIGGLLTGSLALIADAGHMATDAAGLGLALFAMNFGRRPRTPQRTYGFYRMEILASLSNSIVLILLSIYIIYEAYRRIIEPPEIQSFTMSIIAVVGLAVNLVGIFILKERGGRDKGHSHQAILSSALLSLKHEHKQDGELDVKKGKDDRIGEVKEEEEKNLNMQGAYLEVLSDALGSIGVIAAGIIIYTTGFNLADPIISIGLALFILPRTWSLIKKSVSVLMEGVPENISYEEVRQVILNIKGITGVFDLHVWAITSGMNALSAHVVVIDTSKSQTILQEINSILEKRFRITHATIQIERYHSESDIM